MQYGIYASPELQRIRFNITIISTDCVIHIISIVYQMRLY